MAQYVWPFELDDAARLLEIVGTFWSGTYGGSDLVASLLHAKAQEQYQAHLDLLELLAAVSRFKVPVFHTENWAPLVLLESELNAVNLPKWDGTHAFGDGIRYDIPEATNLFAWAAPSSLTDANLILSGITDQRTTYAKGTDFFLTDGAIWFRTNPFLADGVRVENVYEGNEVVDRTAFLWIYRGQWDWDTVYRQFGYVIGLRLRSSRRYRDLVNAIFDGLVEGTTVRCVEEFLEAVCDVPLAEADETVNLVTIDAAGQTVIATDTNAYVYAVGSTALVAAGDAVIAGQPLVDTLRFYEFNRGQIPSVDEIRALTMGRGLLSAAYYRELVFENKTVPLTIVPTTDGYTRVEFEISGWPSDVERFWDEVHTKGVANNDTLAMRLDTRTNKTEQPTAIALPATVNPLGFLLQNVFRGTLLIAVVRPARFGPNALGLHTARLLRKLVPPWVACVVLVQLEADTDSVTMEQPGTETTPGYEEDVDVFLGNTAEDAVDPDDMIAEEMALTQIGGQCQ